MARPKSEFLRGWGKAFEVFKAIVDAVLALGGNDADRLTHLNEFIVAQIPTVTFLANTADGLAA